MRMWLDTEFNEYRGQTISLGIVTERGDEFYEVLEMQEQATPWVEMNVMGKLQKPAINKTELQERLCQWLNQFDSLQIYIDHIADGHRFFRLLETDEQGGWMDLPNMMISVVTGLTGSQAQYSLVEHNALSDARALMTRHLESEYDPNAL